MNECKMDFSSAMPSISKATKLLMRTKGKRITVFSEWRHKKGLPHEQCYVSQYIKAWA